MYLPVVTAHFKNLPQKDNSNSEGGRRLIFRPMAGMPLVYQLHFFLTSAESRALSRAALFLWITPFLAATSALANNTFKPASLGFLRILETASLKASLICELAAAFLLSAFSFLIAPTVIGITAI